MLIHTVFDLLAACAALGMTLFVYNWRLKEAGRKIDSAGPLYGVALLAGAAIGGFGAGTLNLYLSGEPGLGRSIVGALAGAIAAVEIFKRARGISGSTGLIFVPAFATSVVVGRWGCFLAGISDETHGTPTALPWGHDFGDGVMRHPVQLYESFTMLAFLVKAVVAALKKYPEFNASLDGDNLVLKQYWHIGFAADELPVHYRGGVGKSEKRRG